VSMQSAKDDHTVALPGRTDFLCNSLRSRTPPSCAGAGFPRSIWALGLVSLFMDISSEMIHALLPVYLVSVLGASMTAVGSSKASRRRLR